MKEEKRKFTFSNIDIWQGELDSNLYFSSNKDYVEVDPSTFRRCGKIDEILKRGSVKIEDIKWRKIISDSRVVAESLINDVKINRFSNNYYEECKREAIAQISK